MSDTTCTCQTEQYSFGGPVLTWKDDGCPIHGEKMSDTTPSALAMEIAKAVFNANRHLWNNEETLRIIDAKLAEHEASLWKSADDPPDTARCVIVQVRTGEMVEGFYDSGWYRARGHSMYAIRWRPFPAPPREGK